jgi:hypothetical protein
LAAQKKYKTAENQFKVTKDSEQAEKQVAEKRNST